MSEWIFKKHYSMVLVYKKCIFNLKKKQIEDAKDKPIKMSIRKIVMFLGN